MSKKTPLSQYRGSIGLSERALPEYSTLDAHFPESAELDTPLFCFTFI